MTLAFSKIHCTPVDCILNAMFSPLAKNCTFTVNLYNSKSLSASLLKLPNGSIHIGFIQIAELTSSSFMCASVIVPSPTVSPSTSIEIAISHHFCLYHTKSINEKSLICAGSPKSKFLLCISTSISIQSSSNPYSYSYNCPQLP